VAGSDSFVSIDWASKFAGTPNTDIPWGQNDNIVGKYFNLANTADWTVNTPVDATPTVVYNGAARYFLVTLEANFWANTTTIDVSPTPFAYLTLQKSGSFVPDSVVPAIFQTFDIGSESIQSITPRACRTWILSLSPGDTLTVCGQSTWANNDENTEFWAGESIIPSTLDACGAMLTIVGLEPLPPS
jgi:hypothetical protein